MLLADPDHPAPALRVATVEFELRAEQEAVFPRYAGATLRGAIGGALRERACITGAPTCEGCPQYAVCAYGRLWESPPEPPADLPKRFADAPRPWVLDPVQYGNRTRYLPGDRLAFRVHVFGPGLDFVPWLIQAVATAGTRGLGRGRATFRLVRASSVDRQGEAMLLYANDTLSASTPIGVRTLTPARSRALPEAGRVTLHLETPLQLVSNGRTAEHVDPQAFTARLLDRFDRMHLSFEDRPSGLDHQHLRRVAGLARVVHADLVPERFERYSQRASRRVPMEGLLGRVTFDHVVPDLYGLWRLAETLHVGKQATFGFGKVRAQAQED
ncbi:MAG: CRISPR system precrRNA processing endoribonuclease RAMP protein Cas6 [Deltaproteobacteria bacterium]|nr:MAG: CRISPR system precrRNA processing endoribonuclease RAMP protein Cas6 [Deltaproteobacteria bacterium]